MFSEKKCLCCSNCDSHGNNLVSMNCGHRLCINCIKSVRLPSNCCVVCNGSRAKKNRTSASPQDKHQLSEPKTLRQKILSRVRSPSTTHQISESSPDKSNRTYNHSKPHDPEPASPQPMLCRQHNEQLIMYCDRNKELYCAQCVYLKNTRHLHLVPVKNAIDNLLQENRLNREESRGSLAQVQSTIKVCATNRGLFEAGIRQYAEIIANQFEEVRRELNRREAEIQNHIQNLFKTRVEEYSRVIQNLEFLKANLKEYRQQSNKQNNNLNSIIYSFLAYKIIRKTVKNFDYNFIQYTPPDLSVVDLDRRSIFESINNYARLKSDLPLRPLPPPSRMSSLQKRNKQQPNNAHMQSIKQQNQSSHIQVQPSSKRNGSADARHTAVHDARRKQQSSLSSNMYEAPEKNLYERLLNQKFNKYK